MGLTYSDLFDGSPEQDGNEQDSAQQLAAQKKQYLCREKACGCSALPSGPDAERSSAVVSTGWGKLAQVRLADV
jgi:hypothetical protein